MQTQTITRAALIQAVEAGIENAGNVLTIAEKIALRTVAASTDKVARGTYQWGDCGCPLTQIGLHPASNQAAIGGRRLGGFHRTFDDATWTSNNGPQSVLKVVED